MNPYANEKIARQPDHGSPPLGAGDLPLGILGLWGLWRVVKRRRARKLERRHQDFVARIGKKGAP